MCISMVYTFFTQTIRMLGIILRSLQILIALPIRRSQIILGRIVFDAL